MFLKTIGEEEATGRIAELYRAQKAQNGFVMSAIRCWTARPELLPIYQEFSDKVRAGFSLSPRDWRLITLIAAKHVPSTYCSHVYGKQLIADLGSKEAVLAVQRDTAHLSERDVEMLSYAETINRDASKVTHEDICAAEGGRLHRRADLRHCALRRVQSVRQPLLRCYGSGARACIPRHRRRLPPGDDGRQADMIERHSVCWRGGANLPTNRRCQSLSLPTVLQATRALRTASSHAMVACRAAATPASIVAWAPRTIRLRCTRIARALRLSSPRGTSSRRIRCTARRPLSPSTRGARTNGRAPTPSSRQRGAWPSAC